MRRFRVSIRFLMLLVVIVGLGFAALKYPTEWGASAIYTTTLGILLFSLVGAIVRRGNRQLFWTGFSFFGWGYLIYTVRTGSFQPPELSFMTTTTFILFKYRGVRSSLDRLFTVNLPFIVTPEYEQTVHSIITLACGLFGAVVVQIFATKEGDANPSQQP